MAASAPTLTRLLLFPATPIRSEDQVLCLLHLLPDPLLLPLISTLPLPPCSLPLPLAELLRGFADAPQLWLFLTLCSLDHTPPLCGPCSHQSHRDLLWFTGATSHAHLPEALGSALSTIWPASLAAASKPLPLLFLHWSPECLFLRALSPCLLLGHTLSRGLNYHLPLFQCTSEHPQSPHPQLCPWPFPGALLDITPMLQKHLLPSVSRVTLAPALRPPCHSDE